MMRMFAENQRYQTLAPWESADLRPKRSLVKTFQQPEFIVRNQDFSAREVRSILPPIQGTGRLSMEQTKLLKERIGQLLHVARPNVINRITKGIRSADQLNQGVISSERVNGILAAQNVHLDENTKRNLRNKFDPHGRGKISYGEMLAFFTGALNDYKTHVDKNEFVNMPRVALRSKIKHPSMTSSDFNLAPLPKRGIFEEEEFSEIPGAYSRVKLNLAFNERRDAGLRLEIDKSFQDFQGDTLFLFSNMKKKLSAREEDMISLYKLKGIVTSHQLPLNNALIDKLIDRLDPFGSGQVSCKGFLDFLEKALPVSNAFTMPIQSKKKQVIKQKLPDRPKWETRKPLNDIQADKRYTKREETSQDSHDGNGSGKQTEKGSREFERFMKLVTALRRRAKNSDSLLAEDARETIMKYNELFSLRISEKTVEKVLRRNDQNGYVDVDSLIDELGDEI